MGSVPSELSMNFRPIFLSKTIGEFINEVSMIGNEDEKASTVDDLVNRLKEEMRKIDAFKRELPLCMLLLNDAILALKETLQCKAQNVEPVLEEFIPLKRDCNLKIDEIKNEKDSRDKKNWMSSVQLWNSEDCSGLDRKHTLKIQTKKNEEKNSSGKVDLFQSCKSQNEERSFMPFKACSDFPVTTARKEEDKGELPARGLSLLTRGIKTLREESGLIGSKLNCGQGVDVQSILQAGSQQQHASRKQRRCWSHELHRRFVSALQQLGGSQVATPKQIRELMQVNGLTNDEVKSHLQKYRLHSRRVPATTTTAPSPANQSLVAYGMSWKSQDDSPKTSSSQSGSPQGPFQLTLTGGGLSTTGGDDSMDADDDDKSESFSCKSHGNKHMKDDV